MVAQLPIKRVRKIKSVSDEIWEQLGQQDWMEAFSHHPKIGDVKALEKKFKSTAQWASGEQSGVNSAASGVLQKLKQGNDAYEQKFGYIFIVCATGKTAEEMLEMLEQRIKNDLQTEINIAMQEQNKITHLRIDKLFL